MGGLTKLCIYIFLRLINENVKDAILIDVNEPDYRKIDFLAPKYNSDVFVEIITQLAD